MSKTKENLLAAFTGESVARNKYIYYHCCLIKLEER
jgi:rubrerythrin